MEDSCVTVPDKSVSGIFNNYLTFRIVEICMLQLNLLSRQLNAQSKALAVPDFPYKEKVKFFALICRILPQPKSTFARLIWLFLAFQMCLQRLLIVVNYQSVYVRRRKVTLVAFVLFFSIFSTMSFQLNHQSVYVRRRKVTLVTLVAFV